MSSHLKIWVRIPEKEEKHVSIKQSTDCFIHTEADQISRNYVYTGGIVTAWSETMPGVSLFNTQLSHTTTRLPHTQFSLQVQRTWLTLGCMKGPAPGSQRCSALCSWH